MRLALVASGRVLVALGIVAAAMTVPVSVETSGSVAEAQAADQTCAPTFDGMKVEPDSPEGTFRDGIGVSNCYYRGTLDTLIVGVRWAEVDQHPTPSFLCGEPAKEEPAGSGSPPSNVTDLEIPSATHTARLYLVGSYLDADPANKAKAIEFGKAYLAKFERTALPLPCPGAEPTTQTCTVAARDADGRPVPGARILLEHDGRSAQGRSDDKGEARFEDVPIGATVVGTVVLQDASHDPSWFDVTENGFTMSASSTPSVVDASDPCVLQVFATPQATITSEHPGRERWPDAVEIFLRSRDVFRLAGRLGPVTYLPVHVHAFCTLPELACNRTTPHAFAVVGNTPGTEVPDPYIAVIASGSSRTDHNRPDNREYHELGHWYQADLLGGHLPVDCAGAPGSCAHAGYYKNANSTDAWTEGFATFFAMMVEKHVALRPYPELYRMYGMLQNLEVDRVAWGAAGTDEEFALSGILLDLEDGPSDYQKPAKAAPSLQVDCCKVVNGVAYGSVENEESATNGRTARDVRVTVTMPDGTTKEVTTVPGDIPPGSAATIAFAAPEATAGSFAAVARLGRTPSGEDDDPVKIPLKQIITTIRTNPGTKGVPVHDVSELHDVAKKAWGGDRDRNGLDDIDEIFVNHGYFDDANEPPQTWQPGDTIGPSGHQASGPYPAIVPRPEAPAIQGRQVRVDTGGVKATVLVDVSVPKGTKGIRSTTTPAEPDDKGRVLLDPPPVGTKAKITVIAMAPGRAPVVAGTVGSDEVWSHAAKAPDEPAAEFKADVAGAARFTPSSGAGSDGRLRMVLVGAGIASGLVLVGFLVLRRRPRAALAGGVVGLPPGAPPSPVGPAGSPMSARASALPPPTSSLPPPASALPPPASAVMPPGWYADPSGRFQHRYWDGRSWTRHVATRGQQGEDRS